ncbi:MAG: ATP-binding cassette domain-containing protein [Hyphomicrobiales bacterium]
MDLSLDSVAILLDGMPLIGAFSLKVPAGEIATLMGPSGSGKSSLLAYIAGDLEAPLEGRGRILLGGAPLNDTPPQSRRIGRLFQDDLLFPHLTVAENLLFGVSRGSRREREANMRAALRQAELEGFENRPPHTLSGGQRSRIALFRALLANPNAMLLDEPFAKLDAELKQSMRTYVFSHLKERNIPTLLVTHDRDDAPKGGLVLRIGRDGEVKHV